MTRIVSVDPGLDGGIAIFDDDKLVVTRSMPTITIITKTAIRTLKLDAKGKKQHYKSGPNKDKPIYTIKTPAKTKKILDVHTILQYFDGANAIVIEQQNPRPGGSAQASFTTGINYGRLLGAAELSRHSTLVIVSPNKWKADLHITMTKDEKLALGNDKKIITLTLKAKAVSLASMLYKEHVFISDRGKLLDGIAEAVLVGHHYMLGDKNVEI